MILKINLHNVQAVFWRLSIYGEIVKRTPNQLLIVKPRVISE